MPVRPRPCPPAPRAVSARSVKSLWPAALWLAAAALVWAAPATVSPGRAATAGSADAGRPASRAGAPRDLASAWDRDGNGVEDVIDAWAAGAASWEQLRALAADDREEEAAKAGVWPEGTARPAPGPLSRGELRLLCLDGDDSALARAEAAARAAGGGLRILHRVRRCGRVDVLAADPDGLRALLAAGGGRLRLDRDGRPALNTSAKQCGALLAREGAWRLEGDWTASVAILDSGCDTAHDDLGDYSRDNADGPPPGVGDALDWSSAAAGWPLFLEYKVVGWRDVTDDFPAAKGPWDYHYHGTALAGIVAGTGEVDARYRGLAPTGRLTIVKFYDFDGVWRQWAGDFLAACDWLLANRDVYRVRVALCAVNWDEDTGLSDAVAALADAGILLVAAAGNDGAAGTMGWPARHPEALTVGAADDLSRLAAYSSRGPAGSGKPDLVAPGGGITPAAGRITVPDNEPNDTYADRYGTSLAAAHAAAGAFLLGEALRKEGWPTSGDLADVRLVSGLLRATAAPLAVAEGAPGEPEHALPPPRGDPDELQGRGMLQIAAAVEAALQPLVPSASASDSLGGGNLRRVVARRLSVLAGAAYRIEAEPTPGLDVTLEVHDSRRLVDPGSGLPPLFVDAAGAGGRETARWWADTAAPVFVTVKLAAGAGRVTLSLAAEPAAGSPGFAQTLAGPVTGWVNAAALGAAGLPTVVCTGLTDVDVQARQVHALDLAGRERAGWPVTLYPPAGLSGPLTAPLAWDLTAAPGDEIVAASAYGRVYFLTGAGGLQSVDPGLGATALTAPVGLITAADAREVATVTAAGQLLRYSGSGVPLGTTPLGLPSPRAPAAGELDGAAGEELAVAGGDGRLTAVGPGGAVLPGWPVDLGATGLLAPVLVDLDGDGRHEIVTAHAAAGGGRTVVFRTRRGDGSAGPGDGAAVAAPDGGSWRQLSELAVTPAPGGGEPQVVLHGLAAAGAMPDSIRWRLMQVRFAAGGASAQELPAFQVQGRTPAGSLQLRWAQLPPALVWNHTGAAAAEPEALVSLGWEEVVSGNPNLLGAFAGWLRSATAPLTAARLSLWAGGPLMQAPGSLSGALVLTAGEGGPLRITQQGARVAGQPAGRLPAAGPRWAAWRADSRNSGAWPLPGPGPTGVAGTPAPAGLALAPNPASAGLRVAWQGIRPGPARLDIYDVRGRRVRRLHGGALGAEGMLAWDGRADSGAPVAAGLYLFVLEHAGGKLRGRAVVAR